MHPRAADTPQRDTKPPVCRVCGGRAVVEHITEAVRPADPVVPLLPLALVPMLPPAKRYAQVICRICDARGPRVLFLAGDEWPHIAAERDAVADWDCLHRTPQCN